MNEALYFRLYERANKKLQDISFPLSFARARNKKIKYLLNYYLLTTYWLTLLLTFLLTYTHFTQSKCESFAGKILEIYVAQSSEASKSFHAVQGKKDVISQLNLVHSCMNLVP